MDWIFDSLLYFAGWLLAGLCAWRWLVSLLGWYTSDRELQKLRDRLCREGYGLWEPDRHTGTPQFELQPISYGALKQHVESTDSRYNSLSRTYDKNNLELQKLKADREQDIACSQASDRGLLEKLAKERDEAVESLAATKAELEKALADSSINSWRQAQLDHVLAQTELLTAQAAQTRGLTQPSVRSRRRAS